MSRFRAVIATVCALGAAMLTGACAAGQHAATAEERPTLDGTYGTVGKIQIEGVAFHAPHGASYPSGSAVPLSAYIVNNGTSPDKLVKISSSAFTGWNVVSSSDLAGGNSPGATTSGSGQPQTIAPGSAKAFGLTDLSASGAGSPESLVLLGLSKQHAPLFPGSQLAVTFTFANAGEKTLVVPVQLSSTPGTMTLPGASGGPTA